MANSTLPIFRLPNETLDAIIDLAVGPHSRDEEESAWGEMITLFRISHVSWRFRAIALENGRFWAGVVQPTAPPPVFDLVLQRSRPFPIHIIDGGAYNDLSTFHHDPRFESYEEFYSRKLKFDSIRRNYRMVIAESSRWESFIVTVGTAAYWTDLDIGQVWTQPLTHLQTFSIISNPRRPDPVAIPHTVLPQPNLRKLQYHTVSASLYHNPLISSSLSHLSLRSTLGKVPNILDDHPPDSTLWTPGAVILMLSELEALEHLGLELIMFEKSVGARSWSNRGLWSPDDDLARGVQVRLPNLRVLDLKDDFFCHSALLSRIHVPHSCRKKIHSTIVGGCTWKRSSFTVGLANHFRFVPQDLALDTLCIKLGRGLVIRFEAAFKTVFELKINLATIADAYRGNERFFYRSLACEMSSCIRSLRPPSPITTLKLGVGRELSGTWSEDDFRPVADELLPLCSMVKELHVQEVSAATVYLLTGNHNRDGHSIHPNLPAVTHLVVFTSALQPDEPLRPSQRVTSNVGLLFRILTLRMTKGTTVANVRTVTVVRDTSLREPYLEEWFEPGMNRSLGLDSRMVDVSQYRERDAGCSTNLFCPECSQVGCWYETAGLVVGFRGYCDCIRIPLL